MILVNAAKIYSTLGNPNSLVPLAVKDASSCLGMTAGSYVTGKEEGVDRFIDEFGTEILWLGGIPAYKWLFDKTVFKYFGLDSNIDPRNLKDKEVYQKIKEFAPNEEIRKNLEKAEKNKKLFKNLSATKFAVSTVLAAFTYFGMTRLKQYYTDKKIRKNLIKEHEQKQKAAETKNEKQNLSFKGIGKVVEEFAFSPVKNMYIMDGFITLERLTDSRSTQEFIGYAIKEASCLCFLYYAGKKIQAVFENRAKVKHNKSITLDARVLEDDRFKKSFEDGTIEKSIKEFNKANTSKTKLYEFIHKNPDNKIVQIAKQSDVISLLKNSDKIDTRKFIDLKELEGVNSQVAELYGQYKSAMTKGETSDSFFKAVKKLKRGSIRMNIIASILALGVITPGIMLLKRLSNKSDTEFQTKKEIKEQLIKEGIITA